MSFFRPVMNEEQPSRISFSKSFFTRSAKVEKFRLSLEPARNIPGIYDTAVIHLNMYTVSPRKRAVSSRRAAGVVGDGEGGEGGGREGGGQL